MTAKLMLSFFQFFARHGRAVLIAGLVVGIAVPPLAMAMKTYLPELIGFLLFVTALRIDPVAALSKGAGLGRTAGIVVLYQLFIPVVALAAFWFLGWQGGLALGLVLMLAAPSIASSANIAILSGHDGTGALRLMVLGTALVPLTAFPIFFLLPQLGEISAVLGASVRLLLIIFVAAIAAVVVRRLFLNEMAQTTVEALDGFAALTMAVVVIALMAAMGPALWNEPWRFVGVMIVACAVNFGLQVVGWWIAPWLGSQRDRAGLAIIMGNRNLGLFLTALPLSVTDPLLLFIGCYQVPMYLTPLVMGWLYRKN
ncbi:MAG: hypothetical protein AAF903_00165 [Pseudomonadota bacterium]